MKKKSHKRLNAAIAKLLKVRCVIPPTWESAQITQTYLDALGEVVYELIKLSVQKDWKGRYGVAWQLMSPQTHMNRLEDPVPVVSCLSTDEEVDRALRAAIYNAKLSWETVEQIQWIAQEKRLRAAKK